MQRKWCVVLKGSCLCVLVAVGLGIPARAADNYWQHDPATPGDWFDSANWSLLRLPTLSDKAYVTNGGEAQIASGGAQANYLYLGYAKGESGTLNVEAGGQLSSGWGYVGSRNGTQGTATVTGSGSKWTNSWGLEVGVFGGTGALNIEAGGQVSSNWSYLGIMPKGQGAAIVTGSGSKWTNSLGLYVGGWGGTGILTVANGGLVTAETLYASLSDLFGDGTITASGAVLDADLVFNSAHGTKPTLGFGSGGALNLDVDGAGDLGAGYNGTGTLTIADGVEVSSWSGFLGYQAGAQGTATVTGSGSKWTMIAPLYMGYSWDSTGTLNVEAGGQVSTLGGYLGLQEGEGTATVSGSGSKLTITNNLFLGFGGTGTLNIGDGGQVSSRGCYLGYYDQGTAAGTLNITGTDVNITVSELLHFGSNSAITAVPGATIHMTGAAFENYNTDPTDLAGLANLTLIFEGGTGDVDPFEVAGKDLGAVAAGWTNNFVLGTLQLGGVDVGQIRLVNNFDNQPSWVGSEALYVNNLVLNEGAYINLNGLNLYYLNGGGPKKLFFGDANLDGTVNFIDYQRLELGFGKGGTWAQGDFNGDGWVTFADYQILESQFGSGLGSSPTPEPATIALMAIGIGGLLAARKSPGVRIHGLRLKKLKIKMQNAK